MYVLKAKVESYMEFEGVFWSFGCMIKCKDNYVVCDARKGVKYSFLWIRERGN